MRYWLFLICLLTANFSSAQSFKSYVPYNKKGLWGYMDTGMVMRVAPFSKLELGFFDDFGLAKTTDTSGRVGLINKDMKTVLPAKYLRIDIVHNKYVKAEISKWVYLIFNTDGKQLLPFECSEIVFSEDNPDYVLVYAKKDVVSVYQFDDKLKKLVFKRQHEGVGVVGFVDFGHYMIGYRNPNERKIYELNTGIAIEEQTSNRGELGVGLGRGDVGVAEPIISIQESSVKNTDYSRYTDTIDPKLLITAKRKNYYNFNLSHVKAKGKWGVLYRGRNIVLPLIYDTIVNSYSYSNYNTKDNEKVLAWICKLNGKYGLLSTDTSLNIPFVYDKLDLFGAKYLLVKRNGKYGVINSSSKLVIPCEVDSFEIGWRNSVEFTSCSDELIIYAIKGNKIALYGTKGGKTDYLYDLVDVIHEDKKSIHTVSRSIELKQDSLFGLAVCHPNGFQIVPCQFRFIAFHLDRGDHRYYKVLTIKNQLGYIDHRGRKYFED